MRFEAKAALAIGLLLPVLETYRRGFGHWCVEFTTMFEDYLAALLLTAWAWLTSLMTISFVDQVEVTLRGVDIEPQNTDVLVVKFLLLAVSLTALLRSFRRCHRL